MPYYCWIDFQPWQILWIRVNMLTSLLEWGILLFVLFPAIPIWSYDRKFVQVYVQHPLSRKWGVKALLKFLHIFSDLRDKNNNSRSVTFLIKKYRHLNPLSLKSPCAPIYQSFDDVCGNVRVGECLTLTLIMQWQYFSLVLQLRLNRSPRNT